MIEHELKFTVNSSAFTHLLQHTPRTDYERFDVVQHYVADTLAGFVVRLRAITELFGERNTQYFLTLKRETGDDSKRVELEFSISEHEYSESLHTLPVRSCIRKVRIHGPWDGVVDVFPNDTMLYEVENPGVGFKPPSWCERNVTSDRLYRNENMK